MHTMFETWFVYSHITRSLFCFGHMTEKIICVVLVRLLGNLNIKMIIYFSLTYVHNYHKKITNFTRIINFNF